MLVYANYANLAFPLRESFMNYPAYFSWPLLCASSLCVTACLTPDFDFGTRGGASGNADFSSQGDTAADRTSVEGDDTESANDLDSQGSSSVDNNSSGDSSSGDSSSGDSSSGDSSSGDSSSGDSSSGDSNGSDPVDPTPHCLNREVDKDETDTDCGGLDCGGCRDGQTCSIDSDCESSACDDDKTCITPTCFDESGIDCGGSCNDKCNADEGCFDDSDCESVVCEDRVCSAPACDDGVLNGDETDVDCGGADCAACEYGAACSDDADCSVESNSSGTAVCSVSGTCSITCNSGFADCTADGICEDTASDPNRCGGCLLSDPVPGAGAGTVCGASAENTTAACTNSSCDLACVPGYTDNDSNLSNGCENRIADCKEAWVKGVQRLQVSHIGYNWSCRSSGSIQNCASYPPKLTGSFGDGSSNLWNRPPTACYVH